MALDHFEKRELVRALRSIISLLDPTLSESDLACWQHARLTLRPVACAACRAEAMDAAYEQRTAEEAAHGRD